VVVACPSCGARFNLDPAKLLPAGRNVRCAKCDHRWRQMPPGLEQESLEQPAAAEPVEAAPEPAPEAPPAELAAAPPPDDAETHPPTPPETPAEMAQSLAAIAEQVTGARPEGAADANPIARLARKVQPISAPPRMRPMRPARRRSHVGLVLAAGLAIGLLIAAFVFRDVIARTVPGADALYSLLHLSTDNPAADLEISNFVAKITRDESSGHNVIDLAGTIFNLSEDPVNVPVLMVIPIDQVGSRMEPLRFRLRELVVEPGQNINFRKSFDNWPPDAASAVLSWAEAP
jgi:predicted Zn finger-like uncharacterized protein